MKVEVSLLINRPPADVFAYICNFENNPKWQERVVDAWFTSDPPLRRGSTYIQIASFLGRRIKSTFEVIEYQPGRLVRASGAAGLFPITFSRQVEPANGGSRMTVIIEGDASGIFKLAEPLLAQKVKASIEKDCRMLKKMLEN